MASKTATFLCSQCQFVSSKWLGKCPQCTAWNSFEMQTASIGNSSSTAAPLLSLQDIEAKTHGDMISTGSQEFDRVLGGGLVPGQVILFAGEPGVGKSTFLLQAVAHLVNQGHTVAYVSAEESPAQVLQRLHRLVPETSTAFKKLSFIADPIVEHCIAALDSLKPTLLVVDSIQAVRVESVESVPGSGGQIRASGQLFAEWSKQNNCSTLFVGQITKSGSIAGPKLLEHLVDTVLYMQKLDWHTTRVLRSTKNRYGATNELGFFEMTERGLTDKTEVGELLASRQRGTDPGSCLGITIQGNRPLLVEVQALVLEPQYQSTVRRVVEGTSKSRVELILAILSRQYKKVNFAQRDVFLKIAGGLTVKDPGIDLAIAMAIISAGQQKTLPQASVFIGELSLLGYILPASNLSSRLHEAQRMKFKKIYSTPDKESHTKVSVDSAEHLRDLITFFG